MSEDPSVPRLPPRIPENAPYRNRGPDDLFEGEYAQHLRSQMSAEDQEKYRKVGEKMYNAIDFEQTTQSTSTMSAEMLEPLAQLCEQLKSGIHPVDLDEAERALLTEGFGAEWYKRWGYTEADLTEIVSLVNPS